MVVKINLNICFLSPINGSENIFKFIFSPQNMVLKNFVLNIFSFTLGPIMFVFILSDDFHVVEEEFSSSKCVLFRPPEFLRSMFDVLEQNNLDSVLKRCVYSKIHSRGLGGGCLLILSIKPRVFDCGIGDF